MKTNKQGFLVLVPHRDTRLELRRCSAALFKEGFCGAFDFPWAAPLAVLSQPLTDDELKQCARALRETAGKEKIRAAETAAVPFPAGEGMTLFGPRLDIPPAVFDSLRGGAQKITDTFSPAVIGCCLMPAVKDKSPAVPEMPQVSFRAAAVANMYWQPYKLPGAAVGYRWKIGKLIWLPKK